MNLCAQRLDEFVLRQHQGDQVFFGETKESFTIHTDDESSNPQHVKRDIAAHQRQHAEPSTERGGEQLQINPGYTGPTDLVKYKNFKDALALASSALPGNSFLTRFRKLENIMERRVKNRDLIFLMKGKWLTVLLAEELRQIFSRESSPLGNFEPGLKPAAVAYFDFGSRWASAHKRKISQLLQSREDIPS